MPVEGINGILNVESAALHAPQVGVANTNPQHILSVGSNLYVSGDSPDVLTVDGNVVCEGVKVGLIEITPSYDLAAVSNVGNVTSNTIQFTNPDTGIVTTGNVTVGKTLTVEGFRITAQAASVDTLDSITTDDLAEGKINSGVTNNPIHITSAIESVDQYSGALQIGTISGNNGGLGVAGNVHVGQSLVVNTNTLFVDAITDKVGLGTNAPAYTLDVHGNANVGALTVTSVIGLEAGDIPNLSTSKITSGTLSVTRGGTGTTTSTGTGSVVLSNAPTFNGDVTLTGNTFYTNPASVLVDSNMVTEYTGPHSRDPKAVPLKKYPEIIFEEGKFDRNDTTNTYVQAGYTVSASPVFDSSGTYAPWRAFDSVKNLNEFWCSRNNAFDTNGDPTGTISSFDPGNGAASVNAEYITVTLPHKIKLSHLYLNSRPYSSRSNPPRDGYIYGSDNGTDWTLLKAYTNTGFNPNPIVTEVKIIDVGSTDLYNHFALLVTKIYYSGSSSRLYTTLSELELYGYEELATQGDTSVDTTFTSIMNTPQTTGANVYTDAKLSSDFTNQVTGPTPVGTAAVHDNTNKYWEMNGQLTSNIAVEANTFLEGDQPHSVSVWFNSSNLEANVSNTCVFSISDQEKLDSVNLDLQSNTWHNLTYAYQGEGGSRVTYLDGRKVAEDQAEDTFGEYPPFAMTGYAQGGYVASASSEYSSTYQQWEPYGEGGTDAGDSWISGPTQNYFATGTGATGEAYTSGASVADTTVIDGVTTYGEWNQVEFPEKLHLSSVALNGINTADAARYPRDAIVCASIDGNTWTSIGSWTGEVNRAEDNIKHYTLNSTKSFKYVRIVVTKISTGYDGLTMLSRVRYYGHRENDLVRLPDPTNVLKYPHIAMTGPAQRGYVVTESSYAQYNAANLGFGWRAFDSTRSSSSTEFSWQTDSSTYPSSGNARTGVAVETITENSNTHVGSWVTLETPHKIQVSSVELTCPVGIDQYRPNSVVILGSDNNSTWNFLTGDISSTYTNDIRTITITSSVAYKYHMLLVKTTGSVSAGYATTTFLSDIRYYGTGVDSIPIQIGGGNIDKVANFRVYDKFVGEDQALEIWDAQKDLFREVKNSMTLQKGRLGIGTTEPEGRLAVLDEPHNLEEFPPRAMTGYETYMEGHGMFKVSASGLYNPTTYQPYMAFDKRFLSSINFNLQTYNSPSTYTGGNGVYGGTAKLGGFSGEWLQLEIPYKIKLMKFSLSIRGAWTVNAPEDFVIAGYVEDTTSWVELASYTGEAWTGAGDNEEIKIKNINSASYYKRYALVTSKLKSSNNLNIAEWKLFGTREQGQSVLHDGQLTLTKNLNVPRIGPALDTDDTPRRDRLVVEYNTSTNPTFEGAVRDTSGRGNDGILHSSVSYDANEKSFGSFGGGGLETMATNNLLESNGKHSFSAWIRVDTSGTWYAVYGIGGNVTFSGNNSINVYIGSGVFRLESRGGSYRDYGYTFKHGKWVHMAVVYDGTGGFDNFDIYMDTVKLSQGSASDAGTAAITLPTENQTVRFGSTAESSPGAVSSSYLSGAMSSVKFYDTVLTAEEVKTLYDMGRCDEGHHVVNFSKTRVGIGLGDGEAPRAALDVSGGMSRGRFTINQASGTWNQGIALRFLQHGTSDLWDLSIASSSDDNFVFGYNGAARGYFRWNGSNTIQNFTGQHRTFIKDVPFSQVGDLEGLIVSSDQNKYIKMSGGIEAGSNAITTNESLPVVSLSTTTNDKKCFGVISASEDPERREDEYGNFVSVTEKEKGDTRVYINSVGEGAIWVSNIGGSLEAGDYITTSNVAGYGQKQNDDILHNYTVAKITMDCDFEPATQPVQQILRSNVVETYYLGNVHKVKNVPHEFVTTTVTANDDWSNVSVSPSDVTYAEWSNLEANTQNTYTLTYTQTSNVVYDTKYTLTTTANVTESDAWDKVFVDPPTVTYAEWSNLEANTQNTYTLTYTQTTTDEKTPDEWSTLESNVQSLYNKVYYQSVEEEVAKDYPGAVAHTRVTDRIENELDEHGQIQWEDHPTDTEKAYKIRYLDASGVETDSANAVHIAAFVGCTYHCG